MDKLWGVIVVNQDKYPDQFQYIDQWVRALLKKAEDLLQCRAETVGLCVSEQAGKVRGLLEGAEEEIRGV